MVPDALCLSERYVMTLFGEEPDVSPGVSSRRLLACGEAGDRPGPMAWASELLNKAASAAGRVIVDHDDVP